MSALIEHFYAQGTGGVCTLANIGARPGVPPLPMPPPPPVGGVPESIFDVAPGLSRRGWQIPLRCPLNIPSFRTSATVPCVRPEHGSEATAR